MRRPAISRSTILIVLFASSAFAVSAQTQSDVASPLNGQTTAQNSTKVWTNDNIASTGDGIDSSPTVRGKAASASRPKTVSMRGRNAKWYADQITALQSRIPPIDAQIAELQSALDGKAAGNGKTSQRPRFAKIDQWPAQLQDLHTRRQAIVDKIDGLRDEARHNGVLPSALPYPLAQ